MQKLVIQAIAQLDISLFLQAANPSQTNVRSYLPLASAMRAHKSSKEHG